MIFNWDEGILSPLVNITDWDNVYFLYIAPTPDDPVVVDTPVAAFFSLVETDGLVVSVPRVIYDTNALLTDQGTPLVTTPFIVTYHDGSTMAFHDASDVVFHAYVYPDINKSFNVPRTVYSGEAD